MQNLAFGLFGPPITEGELIEKEEMNAINLQGYTSRQKEKVDLVYAKICEQGNTNNHSWEYFLMKVVIKKL